MENVRNNRNDKNKVRINIGLNNIFLNNSIYIYNRF